MKKSILKKYAKLIVVTGANVQKGQDVLLYVGVEQEELASYIVEECYRQKANMVEVKWLSDKIDRITYKKASVKALSYVSEWRIEKEKEINRKLPCVIFIESSDPDALKGVDQKKIAMVQKNLFPIFKPYKDERMNKYQWVIAGAPSKEWAKKVFPDLPARKAMEALWEAILKTSRMSEDPVQAWKEHEEDLNKRTSYLNSLNLDYLHYESKNGTDFKVWLNENAHFLAGGERTLGANIYFNPNIPTEECFTSPIAGKAEGIVYSTKPLSYQGELIENFT